MPLVTLGCSHVAAEGETASVQLTLHRMVNESVEPALPLIDSFVLSTVNSVLGCEFVSVPFLLQENRSSINEVMNKCKPLLIKSKFVVGY